MRNAPRYEVDCLATVGPKAFWPQKMLDGDLYEEHAPRRKMVEGDLYA